MLDLKEISEMSPQELKAWLTRNKLTIRYCKACGFFDERSRFGNVCPICMEDCFLDINVDEDTLQNAINIYEHFKNLPPEEYPWFTFIVTSLARAEYFINIATAKIDGFFAGFLLGLSLMNYVNTKVVCWSLPFKPELRDILVLTCGIDNFAIYDLPGEVHQKLIIIDGLLALKGSANLTVAGWSRSGEIREIVTKFDEIVDMNKRYFAPFYVDALTECGLLYGLSDREREELRSFIRPFLKSLTKRE